MGFPSLDCFLPTCPAGKKEQKGFSYSYFELKGPGEIFTVFFLQISEFPHGFSSGGCREETDTQDLIGRIQLLGWHEPAAVFR